MRTTWKSFQKNRPTSKTGPRSGFSMVELLTVMVILSIVAAFALPAFMNISKGTGVRSTVDALSSAVLGARTQARSTGKSAYVLISNDSNDGNRYLRYAMVGQKDASNVVQPVTKGFAFPQNVYFSRDYSTAAPEVDVNGKKYLAFEFQKNGCLPPATGGATTYYQIVVGAGPFINGEFKMRDGSQDGFYVLSLGRPAFFQDPRQIQKP